MELVDYWLEQGGIQDHFSLTRSVSEPERLILSTELSLSVVSVELIDAMAPSIEIETMPDIIENSIKATNTANVVLKKLFIFLYI